MLTKKEILEQGLVVYIYVGDNKEGVPQFRRVRHPEAVDPKKGVAQIWVEDIHKATDEELMRPVMIDPNNPPEAPKEIGVESTLRQYEGHVIVFDAAGKKVDETSIAEED